MVQAGELGAIRVIQVEYSQDRLSEPLEATGQKQADWRTDPARSGAGGCVGDIGTHAYQLAHFVTGMMPEQILAEATTFVPGRGVDDNIQILLRYGNGARGALWASQISRERQGLRLRVFGEKGGLEWRQEEPNLLVWSPLGDAPRMIRRGTAAMNPPVSASIAFARPSRGLPGSIRDDLSEVAAAITARRSGAPLIRP